MKKLAAISTGVLLFASVAPAFAVPLHSVGIAQQPIALSQKTLSSIPASSDEFVGPFASWINVQTQFGAAGNGVTDDTKALQAAFDSVGKDSSTAMVVYLPAGTYVISDTLKMNDKINVSVIGADPFTTSIKWNGALHGTMMQINGTAYSKFDRITWNGNKKAGVAIDQSWDGQKGHFDTANEYADDIFTDVGIGIQGGHLGHGFAETSIVRDTFVRNTVAGISLGNFNALDTWVWYSTFQDCAIGVTNTYGAGNFKIFNNVFKGSTTTDLALGNTGEFSIRDNTSIGSAGFLSGLFSQNPAVIMIQGNTIIDPINTGAITVRNQGPVTFMDNTIRSLPSASGTVVYLAGSPTSNAISIGNTVTVANAINGGAQLLAYNDRTVSTASLASLSAQHLPGVLPNLNRQIFEVPPGADANTIQMIINQAAQVSGTRPVVHFPYGNYTIASTLTIPANTDIQLVGDGFGDVYASRLTWVGGGRGPVLQINGPSKATVRDMTIVGTTATTGIVVTNADQPGARVYSSAYYSLSNQIGLIANQLDHTLVLGNDDEFSGAAKAVSVIGGPLANSGIQTEGKTVLYAGAESDNAVSHELTNGGTLLVRDTWYEGGRSTFVTLPNSGTFVADNNHISVQANTDSPAITITNFKGNAAFIGNDSSDRLVVTGDGSRANILALGMLTEQNPFVADTTLPAATVRVLNSRTREYNPQAGTGSQQLSDIGSLDQSFITSMLAADRTFHQDVLRALPDAVTDVRLYRVMVTRSAKGLVVQAGSDFADIAPVVNVGTNRSLAATDTSATLVGSTTDPDGNIVSYNWSQQNGPSKAVIATPTAHSTDVTGLTSVGTYDFRLAATDNEGVTANSDILLTIPSLPSTTPPARGAHAITAPDLASPFPATCSAIGLQGSVVCGTITTPTSGVTRPTTTPAIPAPVIGTPPTTVLPITPTPTPTKPSKPSLKQQLLSI